MRRGISEGGICLCRGFLDEAVGVVSGRIHSLAGDGEVSHRAMGGITMECIDGDGEFAHGIVFGACFGHF